MTSAVAAASTRRRGGIALLILAAVLWSLSGPVVKWIKIDPLIFSFWRSLAAGLVMAGIIPLSRGRMPRPGLMGFSIILYSGVVVLLIVAMSFSTAAASILLQYTGPVFGALWGWMFLRRTFSSTTLTALTIATAGILIMVAGEWTGGNPTGAILGVLSGMAFGGLILVLDFLNHRDGQPVNPFAIVCFNNLGAAAIALGFCLANNGIAIQPGTLLIVLATGVIQLAIPYLLFQAALKRVEPVDAALLSLLEPILNPIWVWLLVSEIPSGATFLGGAAILVAMIIEAVKKPESNQ